MSEAPIFRAPHPRLLFRTFVLVGGIIAVFLLGSRSAHAADLGPITSAVQPLSDALEPVTDTVQPVTDTVQPVTDTVAPVTDAVEAVTDSVEPVTETVSTAVEPVTETVSTAVEPVTETVSRTLQPVTETAASLAEPITGTVDDLEGQVTTALIGSLERLVGGTTTGASTPVPVPPRTTSPGARAPGSVVPHPAGGGSPTLSGTGGPLAAFVPSGEIAGRGPPPDPPNVPTGVPVGDPSARLGGSMETGGRGLPSGSAAFLVAALPLAVALSRWLRQGDDARAPNPFLTPIERPG